MIYIVLHALDEFSPHLHLRAQLLAALHDMLARLAYMTGFKLCVSSRIDQEAQQGLRPCSCLSIRPDSETMLWNLASQFLKAGAAENIDPLFACIVRR